jgi:hypothetical protein
MFAQANRKMSWNEKKSSVRAEGQKEVGRRPEREGGKDGRQGRHSSPGPL